MGVKLKKKAKPSPKTGKLLAKVKEAMGQALKKKLQAQMESLPQVDVTITSTPVGSGPPKKLHLSPEAFSSLMVPLLPNNTAKEAALNENADQTKAVGTFSEGKNPVEVLKMWADDVKKGEAQRFSEMKAAAQAEFIKTLSEGSEAVYTNTVHDGVWIDMSEEAFEAFKVAVGKMFTPQQAELFCQVFDGTAVSSPMPPPVVCDPINAADPIVTLAQVAEWIHQVAKIIFDFIHWQIISPEVLLAVRKYIEDSYVEDLLPRLSVGVDVAKVIPKAGVVHRIAVHVRYMLEEKNGPLTDEVEKFFAEVFPTPDIPDKLLAGSLGSIVWTAKQGPNASVFIEGPEQLEAVFSKPPESGPMPDYTAILLQNMKKYMEEHPEAAGVGPLDGAGIVQTLAPFSAVPNKNGKPFIVTTIGGEVVEKKPITGPVVTAVQKLTQKGYATLDRFGVVLKGEAS